MFAQNSRIPLLLNAALERMNLPVIEESAAVAIPETSVPSRILDEFRPLGASLEWKLSQAHWECAGLLPFVDNEVPFLINNNGRLSADAAMLFYTHCLEMEPLPPSISILEIGAGTGLFARYFLDSFQALCLENGKGYYDQLTYVVTDRSGRTVDQWIERALFAVHKARVVPVAFDPIEPQPLPRPTGSLYAVFCNYVLDVMPATIVRAGTEGPEELCVRTHLPIERGLIAQYTARTLDEIVAMAGSGNPTDIAGLAPLLPLFELETAFQPMAAAVPLVDVALEFAAGAGKMPLNYGALRAIDRFLDALDPHGFVLINDYGPVQKEQIEGFCALQRFGPTVAFGINFPLLEFYCLRRHIAISKPDGDDGRGIHSRLLSRAELPRTTGVFRDTFSAEAHAHYETPIREARAHAATGRSHEALDAYREALRRDARNWSLIAEAGEYLSHQLQAHESALEMLRAAIALNPCYSPWLWNALGDCLYCLERQEDAHEAYLQAARIDPGDVRTNLNLAYTLSQSGRIPEALEAIAKGLAQDKYETFRSRLLDKQNQILKLLSNRTAGEQERLARRANRFLAA
jgi:tetratricopeptide (TPR) repeat protein